VSQEISDITKRLMGERFERSRQDSKDDARVDEFTKLGEFWKGRVIPPGSLEELFPHLRRDSVGFLPDLKSGWKQIHPISLFEVRVVYDVLWDGGDKTTKTDIFVASAKSRDDVSLYVTHAYSDVGSVKIREVKFKDLRMSRRCSPAVM
jgi:hypothetical protein